MGTDKRDEQHHLFGRIACVIAEAQEIPRDAVGLDSNFEELGIDSLNAFNLLCDLEEELGVIIPDDRAHRLSTVRELTELVGSLRLSANAPPNVTG